MLTWLTWLDLGSACVHVFVYVRPTPLYDKSNCQRTVFLAFLDPRAKKKGLWGPWGPEKNELGSEKKEFQGSSGKKARKKIVFWGVRGARKNGVFAGGARKKRVLPGGPKKKEFWGPEKKEFLGSKKKEGGPKKKSRGPKKKVAPLDTP